MVTSSCLEMMKSQLMWSMRRQRVNAKYFSLAFSMERARLDMTKLLSQMNKEIELGDNIGLNLLLTRLENIFPPQDDPADENALQAALIASVSHVLKPQRLNEPKTRQADLGNDKSQRGKRKQAARDTNAGESSTVIHWHAGSYSQVTQRH